MQWFKVPPKIYFEDDSIQYLEKMPNISRAFIVTDPTMVKLGNVDKLLHYLRKRPQHCHSEIFSDVESDPSVETIMRGCGYDEPVPARRDHCFGRRLCHGRSQGYVAVL